MAAFATLLLSLTVLYEFFTPSFAEGSQYLDQAFVIASLSWIVGYVNCRGFEWGDNNGVNALYAASWGLLLGMEFTEWVPDQIAAYEPWGAAAAIAVHMIAFGATVIDS
jgi:hypothetical protein